MPAATAAVKLFSADAPARLALEDVRFRYREREVLRGVTLAVRPGEIFGLLGPNGAGKSTLFAILAGVLAPQGGRFFLDGAGIPAGARTLRAAAGIVFQDPGLDGKLTAVENLRLGAALHRVPRALARERIPRLLADAGLADRAREPVERLSGGMRRRLELARALVHAPPLLVMDEPTSGLDAAAFRAFWGKVEALRRDAGTTVLLTTHRPDEAERCDRLAVLARGEVVACDTPEVLRARVPGDVVVIDAEDPEALAADIERRLGLAARVRQGAVHVEREAAHTLVPRIVEAFPAGRLRSVSLRRPTLADAYLQITGEALEDLDEPAHPGRGPAAPVGARRRGAADEPAHPERGAAAPAATRRRATADEPVRAGRRAGAPAAGRGTALGYDLATALVLARRDLVRFFRQPSRLAGALGQPLIFWFVIGHGFGDTFQMPGATVSYVSFFYPGVVAMVVLFAAIFTTASVIEDRHRGFLQSVLAAPGSRGALAAGKALGSASVALTQAALFLLLAPAAGFPWASIHWPLLVAALALVAVALAALGFAVAWGIDNLQGYHAIQMTLLVPLWVVSGAMFPIPRGHAGFAAVMRANPVSYAVSAVRRALAGPSAAGALPGSAARDLAVCAAFAAGALVLAVLATRRSPHP